MKKVFILLFALSLVSCEDESQVPACEGLHCDLIGNWEWDYTYGSIAGATTNPENTGMEQSLEFDENIISFYVDGELVNTYDYQVISTDTIFNDNITRTFIKYNNNTRWYEVSDTSLVLRDLCFDCYDDYYIR